MLKKTFALGVLVLVLGLTALAQPACTTIITTARDQNSLEGRRRRARFHTSGTDNKTYKLSDFKGKKTVVLAFYVLAFTGG